MDKRILHVSASMYVPADGGWEPGEFRFELNDDDVTFDSPNIPDLRFSIEIDTLLILAAAAAEVKRLKEQENLLSNLKVAATYPLDNVHNKGRW